MEDNGLKGVELASGALDITGLGAAHDALTTANRAISNTVDYTVSTGILVLGWVAAGLVILALLGIIRMQNKRADAREKAQEERAAAREKAAEERYRLDAARQQRDIESRDALAKALQELSVLMRTFKCIAPATSQAQSHPQRLLPAPEDIPT